MGRSRRRNKREKNVILEHFKTKAFKTVIAVLFCIIIACTIVVIYRRGNEGKNFLAQKEELNKQIEDIFIATIEDIGNTDGKPKTDTAIKMAAVGDILCGDGIIEDAYNDGNYDFSHMFRNVSQYLKKSDIVLGTLETNLLQQEPSGNTKYNAPKEFAKAVKESGINMISISHNHSLDYGKQGLRRNPKSNK